MVRVVDLAALERRRLAKRRYGRATLTISRWGGLFTDAPLAPRLAAYEAGRATAEEVAWAYVRARVENHSPSFSWETADLTRLIKIVTECSESPHLEAGPPDQLAAALVVARHDQLKVLRSQADRVAETLGVAAKAMAIPALDRWAETQRDSIAAITRELGRSITGTLGAGTIASSLGRGFAGLAMPRLSAEALLGPKPLPGPPLDAFAKLYESAFRGLSDETTLKLRTVIATHETTLPRIADAAREAAGALDRERGPGSSTEIIEVVDEVEAIADELTPHRVVALLQEIADRLTQLQTLQKQQGREAQILFVIGIYFSLYLFLVQVLAER